MGMWNVVRRIPSDAATLIQALIVVVALLLVVILLE
jgi:hypothetical protein